MNGKLKNIEHPGVVEGVCNQQVLVRVKSRTACGDCKSKSYCGLQEVDDKVIKITSEQPEKYETGQNVIVTLKESLGYKALLIGYLFPLIILVLMLVLMMLITGNEPLSALTAVMVMVPYYILVYVFRKRLRQTFKFHIKH